MNITDGQADEQTDRRTNN